MSLRERADAMLERVTLESAWHIGKDATQPVRAALAAALALRDPVIEGDHDPRLLHPARTVLILLSDAGCRDPDTLSAASFVESLDSALRPSADTLRTEAGAAAARIAMSVPLPDEEHLVESLITAPTESVMAALAERLDHARHLHLRPELDWAAFHAQIEAVYVPVARRLSPPLGRRLDRWAEAFKVRRLLRGSRSP